MVVPNSWMVYKGKSHSTRWFGGTPMTQETTIWLQTTSYKWHPPRPSRESEFVEPTKLARSKSAYGGFLSHRGTPRSSSWMGFFPWFSMTNQPFLDTPIYGNPHIVNTPSKVGTLWQSLTHLWPPSLLDLNGLNDGWLEKLTPFTNHLINLDWYMWLYGMYIFHYIVVFFNVKIIVSLSFSIYPSCCISQELYHMCSKIN